MLTLSLHPSYVRMGWVRHAYLGKKIRAAWVMRADSFRQTGELVLVPSGTVRPVDTDLARGEEPEDAHGPVEVVVPGQRDDVAGQANPHGVPSLLGQPSWT